MNKGKSILIFSISLILLIISISTFSYAYIGSHHVNVTGNTNVSGEIINVNNSLSLTMSGDTSLNFSVTKDNLNSANSSNSYTNYVSSTKNVTVSLTSGANYPSGVECLFNIYYNVNTTYIPSAASVNNSLKELTLGIKKGSTDIIPEYDLANKNNKILLVSSRSISTSSPGTVNDVYTFILKFYNLNVDQSDIIGHANNGYISIENQSCEAN